VSKPIGVSEYELTRALPPRLQSALPTVEEIEAELTGSETQPITNKVGSEGKARKPASAKQAKPAAKKQPKQGRRK